MKLALALILVAACSKADPTGGAAGTAANPRDAIVEAWRASGLSPSAFAPQPLSIGGDCATGSIANVDVALCTFKDAGAAKAAEPAGLAWVGETTGMATARGTVLVAAADRKKADVHGKTIDKLMKALPKP